MDMDSDVDSDDVKLYFATYYSNNQITFGSTQSVSSVDGPGGRITTTTAPTTTTAEAGVYATYGYTVADLDYSEVRMAANYLLAHYCSLKIRGETPNYNAIDVPYLRLNVGGSIGFPYDPWKYPYYKAAIEILRDILGKGKDGVGMRRVDAETQ